MFLCAKLAIYFQSFHLAFVSIDNIGEFRPRCVSFDQYFRKNFGHHQPTKIVINKKCSIFVRLDGFIMQW